MNVLETLNLWKTHGITSSTDICFGKIVLQYNRTGIYVTWNIYAVLTEKDLFDEFFLRCSMRQVTLAAVVEEGVGAEVEVVDEVAEW